jgi:4-amino-4-deoxy-L-arabinose transferase-like glycosyltransferase
MEDALRPRALLWMASAVLAQVWLLAARMAGPSDGWDQTQPKTIAYTTDIIIHGRWLLPMERGELPATKPPLYNWLAVPGVKALGFSSELAHKLPSVLALVACWALVIVLGSRIGRAADGPAAKAGLGWLAALMLAANYTMFKLGWLARPDMLLTLWLFIAWACATASMVEPRGKRPVVIILFWVNIALAGLTKGPVAMAPVVYALIAARALAGEWRAVHRLQWWWGLPLAAVIGAAWLHAVWRIDPDHLVQKLWHDEVWGRITGRGPEGNQKGPIGWLTDLPHIASYFIVRFLPWSAAAIAAIIALWRRRESGGRAVRAENGDSDRTARAWLHGAAIWVVMVVVLFTLSTGKRADYIASAFPAGAILAAWWLVCAPPRWAARRPWLVPAAAAMVLAAMTAVNIVQPQQPAPGFSRAIERFIHEAEAQLAADPRPVEFYKAGSTHVQAFLGFSQGEDADRIVKRIRAGERLWVISGRKSSPPHELDDWLAPKKLPDRIAPAGRSADLPRAAGWPEHLTLWSIEPVAADVVEPPAGAE